MSLSTGSRPRGLSPAAVALLAAALTVAGALALTACSTSGASSTGSKGYVAGDGTVTIFDLADRKAAPRLAGAAVGTGTVSLARHAGRVAVLNVWGSWCAPCRAEADDLSAAARKLPDAFFLGVNTRDTESAAESFQRRKRVPYPSLFDPSGEHLLEFYGLVNPASLPTTLVIDARGKVAAMVSGPVTTATLVGLVDDVTDET